MVNRPYPKLSYKYFGPYTVLERIGAVAYRLQLPVSAQVHPVFHVSQLKPFTPNYTPVYTDIPAVPDFTTVAPVPVAILDRRMVRKGNAAAPQVLIQWAHVPPECATWEDYYVIKSRFPEALLWDDEQAQAGGNVTPSSNSADSESLAPDSVTSGPANDDDVDDE